MVNSLSKLENSAETFSIREWLKYQEMPRADQLTMSQTLRDPLRRCTFRTEEVRAVFGFALDSPSTPLIYFWERDLHRMSWARLVARDRVESETISLLKFGAMLSEAHEQNPTLKAFSDFFADKLNVVAPSVRKVLRDMSLYWVQFDQLKFACLYRKKAARVGTEKKSISSSALLECLSFHHDYFHYRSPIWKAVPMRFFAERANGAACLEKIHLHPKTYNPFEDPIPDQFCWPWQACIVRKPADRSLEYRPIRTTSVVMDIRRSTIAMEQLAVEQLGKYSPFINEVVARAIETVFEFGGFFDKETGDGIVAHFVDSDLGGGTESTGSAEKRAFDASVKIIRATTEVCEAFQKELKLGIDELGGSVGVHSGSAVWISELNQVRAIGESVILAARLCGEANTRSVFVSNSFYRKIVEEINPDISARFRRKAYSGKEYKGDAGLFGYEIGIEDSF